MILRTIFKTVMIIAIGVAIYLLVKTLSQYTLDEIMDAVQAIPGTSFLIAVGFAACSYFCLACSDWLAVRNAGKPLPFRQTALASFVSLSIGHNVGVAALSSGAVRYRYYSRWGLTTEDVAKVIVFCGLTVALGLSTLGAMGLFIRPDDAAQMTGFHRDHILMLAAAFMAFPIVYLLLSIFVRKPLHIRKWRLEFPTWPLALGQIVVGTVNFAFVAASLHQMLIAFTEASYLKVAAISITANITSIISHVPGGLGVLEATVVHILPGATSIAAVIAFRVAYYFIPLAIGLPLLIGSEMVLKPEPEPELQKNA